jgi:hypothetical protein
MKKILKQLAFLFALVVGMLSCTEEEMRYLDPMIEGLSNNIDDAVVDINSGEWNNALVGFRDQRIKLLNIANLIATDGYSGENYSLEDKAESSQRVEASIATVEMKLDSVWNANVNDPFAGINKNSAGVVNFGTKKYDQTEISVADIYTWLTADIESEEVVYIANDIAGVKADVEVLMGLAALNDQEVLDFVNALNAKYAEMVQQYADLASEVNSSPLFSKAQKELYASISQPLTDIGTTIANDLSLSTKDELDFIDRDLSGLVYFVANNHTSPVQAPLVFGEISSITELRWFSEVATAVDLDNDWVLTADIDAAETARWHQEDSNGRFGFRPITTTTSINFDGQFHIISGLHMAKVGGAGDEERSGMFSKLVDGSVKNLGLINLRMKKSPGAGNGNQGGTLVGSISGSGSVTKCFVEGTFVGAGSQTGGFIGRPEAMIGEISDCFSVVATSKPTNAAAGGFIGLPVGQVNLYNCYTLGKVLDQRIRAIFGHGSGILLDASGIFYDSETVGTTTIDHPTRYSADTPIRLTDPGVTTDLPTASWGDLANFAGFSAATWEIRTETQFDANPRPYLKGFNYDAIVDFIAVE